MAKNGRKQAENTGWMHPGGSLEESPSDLRPVERERYDRLLVAMEQVGVGGRADTAVVVRCAKIWARMDRLDAEVAALPSMISKNSAGVDCIHPACVELDRLESKFKDYLCSLYMTPRTRGSARLPSQYREQAEASASGVDSDILDLMGK